MSNKNYFIPASFRECLSFMRDRGDGHIDFSDEVYLFEYFKKWSPLLEFRCFSADKKEYALIFLPLQVEIEITAIWKDNPYNAWLLAMLAQTLCLATVRKSWGSHFCLPLPALTPQLRDILNKECIPYGEKIKLQFAIFTFIPVRRNCSVCSLFNSCPKCLIEGKEWTL